MPYQGVQGLTLPPGDEQGKEWLLQLPLEASRPAWRRVPVSRGLAKETNVIWKETTLS